MVAAMAFASHEGSASGRLHLSFARRPRLRAMKYLRAVSYTHLMGNFNDATILKSFGDVPENLDEL